MKNYGTAARERARERIVHLDEPGKRSPIYPGGYDPCGPTVETTKPGPDPLRVAAYTKRLADNMKRAKLEQASPTGPREDEPFNPSKEIRTGTPNPFATGPAPVEWKPTENS